LLVGDEKKEKILQLDNDDFSDDGNDITLTTESKN